MEEAEEEASTVEAAVADSTAAAWAVDIMAAEDTLAATRIPAEADTEADLPIAEADIIAAADIIVVEAITAMAGAAATGGVADIGVTRVTVTDRVSD